MIKEITTRRYEIITENVKKETEKIDLRHNRQISHTTEREMFKEFDKIKKIFSGFVTNKKYTIIYTEMTNLANYKKWADYCRIFEVVTDKIIKITDSYIFLDNGSRIKKSNIVAVVR